MTKNIAGGYDSPVVVIANRLKPFTHASVVNEKRPLSPDAVVSGFFVGSHKTRGYHPPLYAVEATKYDKRGELALCLLGEHPSGQ